MELHFNNRPIITLQNKTKEGLSMKNKKFVSFIIIVASIILLFLAFKSIDESTKGTLIEFIEQSSEPDKPFVMESLIYGYTSKLSKIEDDSATSYIQLTEQEIRTLLNILSTTTFERIDPLKHKIKISFWEENTNDLYSVDITNRGYTMSYDIKVDFWIHHIMISFFYGHQQSVTF